MKKVNYDLKDAQNELGIEIASLKVQLANERAAKKAIIKYAEELELKLEQYEKESEEE